MTRNIYQTIISYTRTRSHTKSCFFIKKRNLSETKEMMNMSIKIEIRTEENKEKIRKKI